MAEAVKDRSAYQRDYYEKRRDDLSQKRKQKYRSDPDARRRAIEASRAYRAKRKQLKEAQRSENGSAPSGNRPRPAVTINIGGLTVKAHTISELSKRIERSRDTINNWINNGTIPKTPFRSKRGDRLYSDGMIITIKIAIHARNVVRRDSGVREEILNGWRELGVEI